MTSIDAQGGRVHDLVVAGFGPSGIALAAAADDHDDAHPDRARIDAVYLERAADSAWQPNMMLPGTDIQHHFLRDFATPRDPRSRFTFPNYLNQSGRFFPFTLMGGYVSRREWSDYVEWAAGQVTQPVEYHREVLEVVPVRDGDGTVRTARVVSRDTRDGSLHTHQGRNVALAVGHAAHVPEIFRPHLGERVFHAQQLLPRLALLPSGATRFAVVGGGQNAGEIVLHLAGAYPDAQVHSLVRHQGFRTYDLGHFSNEVYFPEETDYFYNLDAEQRRRAMAAARATNYAAVDPDVSTALYQAAYEDRLTGRRRLHMHRRSDITAVEQSDTGIRMELTEVHTGEPRSIEVDVVVLCTGFTESRFPAALEPFRPYLRTEADGDLAVTRAYRAETTEDCEVGLYLDGITEWRHGIGNATSFSQMAVKADTIHRDLRARLAAPARELATV